MGDDAASSCAHDSGGLGRGARADTGHGPWLPLPALSAVAHQGCSVRALMHAPPRLALGSGLNACNASRDDPVCLAASRQCSRQLASLSLFTSTTLQLWGTEALLDWLLRHRSRQSKRGDNVPIKMTCAVYQQILALFISKSSPLLCSKLSQKVIIDDQWSL